MKKYPVLYRAPISSREQMADAMREQANDGVDTWMAWAGRAGSAIVDMVRQPAIESSSRKGDPWACGPLRCHAVKVRR